MDDRGATLFRRTATRRQFLADAALLGAAGLATSGCAGPLISQAAGTRTVTYWNLFTGGDGQRMIQMQDAFAKKQRNIKLNAVTLTWGTPYYTKLAMSIVAGRSPDIAILHMSRLPSYAPAKLLEPLDVRQLARHGITPSHFPPQIWQKAHSNGKLYAIPLDTHPLVMYYNKAVCKKAGLLGPDGKLKPLSGPRALLDAFKRAKKVTGVWGLSLDAQDVMPWRIFYLLYTQMGGKIMAGGGNQPVLDHARSLKVMQFMTELTQGSKVAPPNTDYAGSVAIFGGGKAGFFWSGSWEVTTFQTQKMPFDVTLSPNVFGTQQTWADSHAFVIPRQKTADPGRLDASLTFASSMLKESVTWSLGGNVPVYGPVFHGSKFQKLTPQAHYAPEIQHVVYDPPTWYAGAASTLETQAGAALQAVLSGQLSPEAGYKQFTDSYKALIDEPRPF